MSPSFCLIFNPSFQAALLEQIVSFSLFLSVSHLHLFPSPCLLICCLLSLPHFLSSCLSLSFAPLLSVCSSMKLQRSKQLFNQNPVWGTAAMTETAHLKYCVSVCIHVLYSTWLDVCVNIVSEWGGVCLDLFGCLFCKFAWVFFVFVLFRWALIHK